jgi:hypothetical protein
MKIAFDKETPWGSLVAPSTSFCKSWDITNKGSLPWPKGTCVQRISPNKFSPSFFGKRIVSDDVVVAGETVEIRFVKLKAPPEDGTYVEVWALSDQEGHLFGERLEIRICVGKVDKHARSRYFASKDAMESSKEGQDDLRKEMQGSMGWEPYRMLIRSSKLPAQQKD